MPEKKELASPCVEGACLRHEVRCLGQSNGVRTSPRDYCFTKVAATNQRFNSNARQQANNLQVELVEAADLAELLTRHPIKRSEFYISVSANWLAEK